MSEKINRSVARALDMLELVAASKNELTITEISKQLGIPKSTTFDILYTLLDKGYLEQANEKQKSFKLGVKLFQTGACYLEQTPFHNVAHTMLEKLAEIAGKPCFWRCSITMSWFISIKWKAPTPSEPPPELVRTTRCTAPGWVKRSWQPCLTMR